MWWGWFERRLFDAPAVNLSNNQKQPVGIASCTSVWTLAWIIRPCCCIAVWSVLKPQLAEGRLEPHYHTFLCMKLLGNRCNAKTWAQVGTPQPYKLKPLLHKRGATGATIQLESFVLGFCLLLGCSAADLDAFIPMPMPSHFYTKHPQENVSTKTIISQSSFVLRTRAAAHFNH